MHYTLFVCQGCSWIFVVGGSRFQVVWEMEVLQQGPGQSPISKI